MLESMQSLKRTYLDQKAVKEETPKPLHNDDGSAIYEIDRNTEGEKLVAVRIEGKWYQVKYPEKGVDEE